jgi:hypothetical protein
MERDDDTFAIHNDDITSNQVKGSTSMVQDAPPSTTTITNNIYSSPLNQSFTDLLGHEEETGTLKDTQGRKSLCGTPPMSAIPKIIESPSPTSSRYSIKSRLSIDSTNHPKSTIPTNNPNVNVTGRKQGRSGSLSSITSFQPSNTSNNPSECSTLPALVNVLQEDSYSECEEYPTTERLLSKLKKSTSSNASSVGSSSPIKKMVMSSGDIGMDVLSPASNPEDATQEHESVGMEEVDGVVKV